MLVWNKNNYEGVLVCNKKVLDIIKNRQTHGLIIIFLFIFLILLLTFTIIVIFNDIQAFYFLIKPIGLISIIASIVIFVLAERYTKKYNNKTFFDLYRKIDKS